MHACFLGFIYISLGITVTGRMRVLGIDGKLPSHLEERKTANLPEFSNPTVEWYQQAIIAVVHMFCLQLDDQKHPKQMPCSMQEP